MFSHNYCVNCGMQISNMVVITVPYVENQDYICRIVVCLDDLAYMAINGETGITGNFGSRGGEFCSFKTGIPGGPATRGVETVFVFFMVSLKTNKNREKLRFSFFIVF
jgi:hypothetical protein